MDSQRQIFMDETKPTLKGNLHTHTNRGDGAYSAQQVIGLYEGAGYDFIAITDHDLYYEGQPETSPAGMLVIPGIEASCLYHGDDPTQGAYCHFTCLCKKEGADFAPGTYRTAAELQAYLQRLKGQFRMVQVNHPLFPKLPDSDWAAVKGYDLFEVYNHKDFFVETGEESAQWLARTLLNHRKHFFVTAGDDFHGPRNYGKMDECFGGFVMVQAEKNREAILTALENGNFYASTGPRIYHYERDGQRIKIKTSAASRITFYSNLRRSKQVYHTDGSLVSQAAYELDGRELYLWTKVTDAQGHAAWTQPIFFPTTQK